MNIFRLDKDRKVYTKIGSLGEMLPFAEASLMKQAIPYIRGLPRDNGRTLLVFSKREEKRIMALLGKVVGGLEINKGHGHGSPFEWELLDYLMKSEQYQKVFISADGDASKPISETTEWLLAVGHRST